MKNKFIKIYNISSFVILLIAIIIDVIYSTNISGLVFFVSTVFLAGYSIAKLRKKDKITTGEKLYIVSAVLISVYAFIDAFFQDFGQEHFSAFTNLSEIIYLIFIVTSFKLNKEE